MGASAPPKATPTASAPQPIRRCTWLGCVAVATHEQTATDGVVWADLCDPHHRQLDEAKASGSAPKLLGAWMRAQGGAAKAAERF